MMLALVGFAALIALAWTALAVRFVRLARGASNRFLGPVSGTIPPDAPSVAAVVPARNEAEHVAATVASLREQEYPHLAITVVDDQSTDATGAILRRLASEATAGPTLRVVAGSERPAGWVGKTWAVHQGAEASPGDWLWFVDADMALHRRALATAVAEADRTGADLVSLLPRARCASFWQGSIGLAFIQLLGQLYALDRVNDPTRPDAMAAGGFILVRRSAYDRAGGHAAVRHSIVDDIELARRVKAAGGRLAVRLAPDLASTHMYGSFGAIWRGLRKNAYAGMDFMPHKYATGAVVALSLAWAPWAALIAGAWAGSSWALVAGGWGVAAQMAAAAPGLWFLGLPGWFVATMPAGISAYVAIATASAWHHHRGRILWKDRTIAAAVATRRDQTAVGG